jgi:acyl dehydratase
MSIEYQPLPLYRVRARNTSADSENKIHDDTVAASYGFRGGLVPGVTVYGYMTAPIVARFEHDWLERGSMQVKFHQPFYEGEEVGVLAEVDGDSEPPKISVFARREDGTVCATGLATVNDGSRWLGEPRLEDYPPADLPAYDARPPASRETCIPGKTLGTLKERIDLRDAESGLLRRIDEHLDLYFGEDAVAHPAMLLAMANHSLMHNFELGPWIHTASDLINLSLARDGEEISVRGRVADCYERKGHEFVVLNLLLVANGQRPVQQVRHTAIYKPRVKSEPD